MGGKSGNLNAGNGATQKVAPWLSPYKENSQSLVQRLPGVALKTPEVRSAGVDKRMGRGKWLGQVTLSPF